MATVRFRLVTAGSAALVLLLSASQPGEAQAVEAERTLSGPMEGVDRQPEWTARPLFAESGVYALPKGVTALAFGLRPAIAPDGAVTTESAYQADFGLPARFQVGVHATGRARDPHDAIGNIDAQTLALRWAVANWGTVWGNPAVQVEWREASRGADAATVTLLLGGGTASRWRWGANAVWMQEAGGDRSRDRTATFGVSYAPGRFVSIGAETRAALVDRLGADGSSRTAPAGELVAGPSIQIRPLRRMFINLASLFDAAAEAPTRRTTIAGGWAF